MKHLTLIALAVLICGCSGGTSGDAKAVGATGDNNAPNQATVASTGDSASKQTGGLNPNDSATEAEFPIPFYPGSTEDNRSPIPTMGHDHPGGERSLGSNRVTTDSVQKVFDFYKPKLSKVVSQNVTPDLVTLTGSAANGDKVTVAIKREDQGASIALGVEVLKK